MRSAVVLADSAGSGARTPPIKRAVNRVAPAVDEVVVSCRREQRESIEAALKTKSYRLAMGSVPRRRHSQRLSGRPRCGDVRHDL